MHRLLRDVSTALFSRKKIRQPGGARTHISGVFKPLSSTSGLCVSGFGPLPLPVTREVLAGLFATAFPAERVEQDAVKQELGTATTRVWAANAFAFRNPEWESELEQISTR